MNRNSDGSIEFSAEESGALFRALYTALRSCEAEAGQMMLEAAAKGKAPYEEISHEELNAQEFTKLHAKIAEFLWGFGIDPLD